MLRKPGPATSTALDAVLRPQLGGQQLGDLARRPAGGLGQPQRHVGGVVAVLRVLRPLDDDLGRDVDGQLTSAHDRPDGGPDDVLQLLRCHRTSVLTAARRARRGRPAARGCPGRRPRLGRGVRSAAPWRPHRGPASRRGLGQGPHAREGTPHRGEQGRQRQPRRRRSPRQGRRTRPGEHRRRAAAALGADRRRARRRAVRRRRHHLRGGQGQRGRTRARSTPSTRSPASRATTTPPARST